MNVSRGEDPPLELLERVERGETIVIARAWHAGRGALSYVDPALQPRVPGRYEGKIWMSDDFDDPIPGFEDYT